MDFIRKKATSAFTHPPDEPGIGFGPTDIQQQQQQGKVLEQSAMDLEEEDQHPCEVEPQGAKPQRAVVGQESAGPPIHQEPIKERDRNTNQLSDLSNRQEDMAGRRDIKPPTTTTGATGTTATGATGATTGGATAGAGTGAAGAAGIAAGAGAATGAATGLATDAAPGATAGVSGTHTPVWAYVPTKTAPPANPEIMSKRPSIHNQHVVDGARSLPSTHQMPPLPAAGCFDLDAPGNAPIITGYNHDHRSVTSKIAQNVNDSYEKNQALKRSKMSSTIDKMATTSSEDHTGAKTAAGIAAGSAAVGAAAAGGIVAKCMDYLRGGESKDASQDWDEVVSSSEGGLQDEQSKATAAPMPQTSTQQEQGAGKIQDEDWKTQDDATKLNKLGEEGHYNTSGQQVLHEPEGGGIAPSNDLASDRAVIDDDVNKLQPTGAGSAIDHSQDIANGKTPSTTYSYTRVDDNKTPSSFYGQSIDQRGASHENAGIGAGIGAGVGAATGGGIAAISSAHRRKNKQDTGDVLDQSEKSAPLDETYGATSAIDPYAQSRQPRSSIEDDMTMHDDTGMRSDIKGSSDPYNTRPFGYTEQDQPSSGVNAVERNGPSSMGAWDKIDHAPSKTTTSTGYVSKDDAKPFIQDETSKTSTAHDQQQPARPGEFLFDEPHNRGYNETATTATSGIAGAGIGASVGAASAAGLNKHKQRERGFDDVDQAIETSGGNDQRPIDDTKATSNIGQKKSWEEPPVRTGQQQPEEINVIEDVENGGLRETSDQQKHGGIFEPRSTPRGSSAAKDTGIGAGIGAGAGGATAAAAAAALAKDDKLKSQQQETINSGSDQQPGDQIKKQQYQGPGGVTDQEPVTDRIQPEDQQHIAEKFEDQQQRQEGQLQDDIAQQSSQQSTGPIDQDQQQFSQQHDYSKKSMGVGAGLGAAAGGAAGIASTAGLGNKAKLAGQAQDLDQQPGQQDMMQQASQQPFGQEQQPSQGLQQQQQQQQPFSSEQNFEPSREETYDKAYGQQHHREQPQEQQQLREQQAQQQQVGQQQQLGADKQLPEQPQEPSNVSSGQNKFNPKSMLGGQAKQQFTNMTGMNVPGSNMMQQADQAANLKGSGGGIAGAFGAGAGAVAGGLGAAIGAARRHSSKTKSTEGLEHQGVPKTLDGAVGGVDDEAVGNLTTRQEHEASMPRNASEQPRSSSMGGRNATAAAGGAGGAAGAAGGIASQQEPIPASQIIQQGGVIYHDQPSLQQRGSSGGQANTYEEAPTTGMNKSAGGDTGASTYQPTGSSQAAQQGNAILVDQNGNKISASQIKQQPTDAQYPIGYQQQQQSVGQQQYQPMGEQASTGNMGQSTEQQQYPMKQAGADTTQQPQQHLQQQPMSNAATTQGGAAGDPRRVSFQDYVSGKIDKRRASFKESMGKIFHKDSWKQGGQEQKSEAQHAIDGYDRIRNQTREGAAM